MLVFRNDVIDANDAVGMQDIVDAARFCSHLGRCFGAESGRSNLLYLSVILGIVVEELVLCNDFRSRKHHFLIACLVNSLRDFDAINELFDHHLIAFHERNAQGWGQTVGILHLGNAETATIGRRFHEARHA